jgi:hypothetical protein
MAEPWRAAASLGRRVRNAYHGFLAHPIENGVIAGLLLVAVPTTWQMIEAGSRAEHARAVEAAEKSARQAAERQRSHPLGHHRIKPVPVAAAKVQDATPTLRPTP